MQTLENDVKDKASEAAEEYFENQATGVEIEPVESDLPEDEPRPWDPDQIRIHTKAFSLRQVVDMIGDEDIDLAPDFQRAYVWKGKQKSRLIESILLGIPIPSFYFMEDQEGRMQVVDGVQRLTTIYGFVREKAFELSDLEYLDELDGLGFEALSAPMRRRFNLTQVLAHVIDPQTPTAVKFDVFKRINTGGSPLSAQEIRHCMSGTRARKLLRDCTQLASFHRATRNSLKDHIRMADREVVLRFIAFHRATTGEYGQHRSLDAFLSAATDEIEALPDDLHRKIVHDFDRAMTLALDVFGDVAFRKGPGKPLNRALFDVWSNVLIEHEDDQIRAASSEIAAAAQAAIDEDPDFMRAISQGTGGRKRVAYRFAKARQMTEKALLNAKFNDVDWEADIDGGFFD